jgi:hypothetical protein
VINLHAHLVFSGAEQSDLHVSRTDDGVLLVEIDPVDAVAVPPVFAGFTVVLAVSRLKRPLSRGSSPASYPAKPLVSFQINRTTLWVDSSSTDDSRLRGARPKGDIAATIFSSPTAWRFRGRSR